MQTLLCPLMLSARSGYSIFFHRSLMWCYQPRRPAARGSSAAPGVKSSKATLKTLLVTGGEQEEKGGQRHLAEGEECGRHEPRCGYHNSSWSLLHQREGCWQRDKPGCPRHCVSTGQGGRRWAAERTGRAGRGGSLTLAPAAPMAITSPGLGPIPATTGAAGRAGRAQPMGRVLLPM